MFESSSARFINGISSVTRQSYFIFTCLTDKDTIVSHLTALPDWVLLSWAQSLFSKNRTHDLPFFFLALGYMMPLMESLP